MARFRRRRSRRDVRRDSGKASLREAAGLPPDKPDDPAHGKPTNVGDPIKPTPRGQ